MKPTTINKNTKIVFLCSRPADYLLQCINLLGNQANVIVFHQPPSINAPFDLTKYPNIKLYNFKDFSTSKDLLTKINCQADIVVTAGWTFKDFLKISFYFKRNGAMTVMMSDTPWEGRFKQYILILFSPFLKCIFSHMWVAGEKQINYANKLGFYNERILKHLYSASYKFTNTENKITRFNKEVKTLLYAGRLLPYKGIDLICESYNLLYSQYGHFWKLKVIGNGPLKEELIAKFKNIDFISFMQPNDLHECMQDSEAFILASDLENWGVTVHEAAACGLPLILTKNIGAASVFLKSSVNGLEIENRTIAGIKSTLEKFFNLTNKDLILMSNKSKEFSNKITEDIWVTQLTENFSIFKTN